MFVYISRLYRVYNCILHYSVEKDQFYEWPGLVRQAGFQTVLKVAWKPMNNREEDSSKNIIKEKGLSWVTLVFFPDLYKGKNLPDLMLEDWASLPWFWECVARCVVSQPSCILDRWLVLLSIGRFLLTLKNNTEINWNHSPFFPGLRAEVEAALLYTERSRASFRGNSHKILPTEEFWC